MKPFCLVFSLLLSCGAWAQSDSTKQEKWGATAFYGHIGTNIILLPIVSANLEITNHHPSGKSHVGISFGAYFAGTPLGSVGPVFSGRGMLHIWTGPNKHHFEMRLGAMYVGDEDFEVFPLIQAGYRFQKPYSPNFWFTNIGFLGGIGFGVGRTFR